MFANVGAKIAKPLTFFAKAMFHEILLNVKNAQQLFVTLNSLYIAVHENKESVFEALNCWKIGIIVGFAPFLN